MTLEDVKQEVQKYVYMEDTTMIDASLAVILANRMRLGSPVWLVIIGASSGGKSQILKPLALSDGKYMHRIDDVTENTFLSGAKLGDGKTASLLHRIGSEGMLVVSDLTVIFSRNVESRNAILSQFRMLYDGEMTKSVGNSEEPIRWKGHLGILAGSTPTIYRHLEEVADMGERFMYWRMHEYDEKKASELAMRRTVHGDTLDRIMAETYDTYVREVVGSSVKPHLTETEITQIIDIAILAEKMRAVVRVDKFSKQIEHIPCPAFPMRTALQLRHIAEALSIMYGGALGEQGMQTIRWLGWSLANEEKRKCLQILAGQQEAVSTQAVADVLGLDTTSTRNILQSLASVQLLTRSGETSGHTWEFSHYEDKNLVIQTLVGNVGKRVLERGRTRGEEEVNVDEVPF